MAKTETFTISRQELRKALISMGVGEKSINSLTSSMERTHRHINAVAFAALLEKAGLDRDRITNVFRRLGMDDLEIKKVLDTADEQKVITETGRLFVADVQY